MKLLEKALEVRDSEEVRAVLKCVREKDATAGLYSQLNYCYGDLIVKDGVFQLPGMNCEPDPCEQCRKDQDRYTARDPVPLLLNLGFTKEEGGLASILNRKLEISRVFQDTYAPTEMGKDHGYRTVPVAYRQAGELLGLFETLRPLVGRPKHYGKFLVSAGSRNIHLTLPFDFDNGSSDIVERLSKVGPHSKGDPHANIRSTYRSLDATQYGISDLKSSYLKGIASDWRVLRKILGEGAWKVSLLLLPPDLIDDLSQLAGPKPPENLLRGLFRAGFEQLQDALEALTASGLVDIPKSLTLMNIEAESVPTVLAHLRACVKGEAFVHAPAQGDANGPWPNFYEWSPLWSDHEVQTLEYCPIILEPRRLDGGPAGSGFVSLIHPLTPHAIRFSTLERQPNKWKGNFKNQLDDVIDWIGIYPDSLDELSRLKDKNPANWPQLPERGKRVARLKNTCLEQFVTVRHRAHSAPEAVSQSKKAKRQSQRP